MVLFYGFIFLCFICFILFICYFLCGSFLSGRPIECCCQRDLDCFCRHFTYHSLFETNTNGSGIQYFQPNFSYLGIFWLENYLLKMCGLYNIWYFCNKIRRVFQLSFHVPSPPPTPKGVNVLTHSDKSRAEVIKLIVSHGLSVECTR